MKTVLLAGGGTGGHLMPALAIAEAMLGLDHDIQPFFVGSRRGVEAHVLPARPWRYELLPLEPIYRRRWWRNAILPVSTVRTMLGIRRIMAATRPALIVGTGGYVSGPVVWAAVRAGIPAILQEQNAFPGITTRRLAARARQVHLGFPEAREFLKPGKNTVIVDSGNPIVPPPNPLPAREEAKRAIGFDPHRPVVLVMGGSQGALAINRAVAAGLPAWPEGCQVVWQTGQGSFAEFQGWGRPGVVQVEAFLDPIARAYAAADLVVARSGAMSLAELAAWGLPCVLVPLPTAAANHQFHNAKALADAGAAELLEQSNLTGQSLAETVSRLLADPARLAGLASAIRSRARPFAAREIAQHALSLL